MLADQAQQLIRGGYCPYGVDFSCAMHTYSFKLPGVIPRKALFVCFDCTKVLYGIVVQTIISCKCTHSIKTSRQHLAEGLRRQADLSASVEHEVGESAADGRVDHGIR